MSDRIAEIRSRLTAALQAAKTERDRQNQGFRIPCLEGAAAIRKWEAHEVYAILHRYRNENRATKAARKRQKQARKANRSRK